MMYLRCVMLSMYDESHCKTAGNILSIEVFLGQAASLADSTRGLIAEIMLTFPAKDAIIWTTSCTLRMRSRSYQEEGQHLSDELIITASAIYPLYIVNLLGVVCNRPTHIWHLSSSWPQGSGKKDTICIPDAKLTSLSPFDGRVNGFQAMSQALRNEAM